MIKDLLVLILIIFLAFHGNTPRDPALYTTADTFSNGKEVYDSTPSGPSISDYVYTNTVNKFQILIKNGMNFISAPNSFMVASLENDSSLRPYCYTVTGGSLVLHDMIKAGGFLAKVQADSDGRIKFSNIKIQANAYGPIIEEGTVVVDTVNNGRMYGVIKAYLDDTRYFIVEVLYKTELLASSGIRVTQEIFNSFNILPDPLLNEQ